MIFPLNSNIGYRAHSCLLVCIQNVPAEMLSFKQNITDEEFARLYMMTCMHIHSTNIAKIKNLFVLQLH